MNLAICTFFFSLFNVLLINGQTTNSIYEVCHCDTPTQDSLQTWCTMPYQSLTFENNRYSKAIDSNGSLFTGWVCDNNPSNIHQYLYFQYENGILIRKIGFFSNGNIDHDFRVKNSESFDCERMWRENGDPYVANYYIKPGVKHGYQKRWYADQKIAMIAYYEYGKCIYQIDYDEAGHIISSRGKLPTE